MIRGISCLLVFVFVILYSLPVSAQAKRAVEKVFEDDNRNHLVMQVEAAIASAQSEFGIVSVEAAEEITARAGTDYAPLDEVAEEYQQVRHRMVALLNVWRRNLSPEAGDALHLGVTTVDVYDTVMILQILDATDIMLDQMLEIEQELACLALTHRDTPMMGRTLGQHALPITFGKKVSVWLGHNRRNIDRLFEVRARLRSAGVLKGAVGSYAGLGEFGVDIERGVSARLGLDVPEPTDWRAARDVFAEYTQVLALIAKSNAAIGAEVFRLQTTDIAEVWEVRPSGAVGSSTMPHKRNPSLSEALIYYGRTIPSLSAVILDDVESVFERDNTSRPNRTLEEISIEAVSMLNDTNRLIGRLKVDKDRMYENLFRTDGMVMSQQVMLFLTRLVGRDIAETRVREAAEASLNRQASFKAALLADEVIGPLLKAELDSLLDPTRSLGLASKQVELTVSWVEERRSARAQPALDGCRLSND